MELQNKCILVAGGASGLGAACVRMLVGAGAQALIADLNVDAGNALAQELGANAFFVQTDIVNEEDVQRALRVAIEQYGHLYGVINCAGIGHAELLSGRRGAHSLESFRKVITINLIGTFTVASQAAELMRKNEPLASGERGVIINTASIAAFEGQIGQVAYSASKGGIVGMILPMARELARYGIRVVAIAPGTFDTPLLAGLPAPARATLAQQVPFPSRLGLPEEYAALARHLFENEMLNGEVIRLDGALRLPFRQ